MAPLASKCKMEGWWWRLGTSVLRFNVREGGKGQKQPPLMSKHEMEGWWWGLGTSVLHFDMREGGDGHVLIQGRVVLVVVVVNNVVCSMLMFIYITKCILLL